MKKSILVSAILICVTLMSAYSQGGGEKYIPCRCEHLHKEACHPTLLSCCHVYKHNIETCKRCGNPVCVPVRDFDIPRPDKKEPKMPELEPKMPRYYFDEELIITSNLGSMSKRD